MLLYHPHHQPSSLIGAENRAIVPALWPGDLGKIAKEPFNQQVCSSWRYVPETPDALYDWGVIVDDTSPTARPGQRHFVYAPDVAEAMWNTDDVPKNCDILLILHGFLASGDLSALGNWSKYVSDPLPSLPMNLTSTRKANNAPSARRTLVLASGGCTIPFNAQKRALNILTDHIVLQVGAVHLPDFGTPDEIRLNHQVFCKVRHRRLARSRRLPFNR